NLIHFFAEIFLIKMPTGYVKNNIFMPKLSSTYCMKTLQRFFLGVVFLLTLLLMFESCAPTRRTTTHKKHKSVPCPCENEGRR
ncbi:MAG: hypothetical protein KBG80_01745, partial [Breznakibacter sp.]|nr:hypothetical protein [Breznakibacter sp.]